MRNQEVAEMLDRIALLLEASGEAERFKVIAYRRAATSIRNLGEEIERVRQEGKLEDIPYVGKAIAEKTAEFIDTGKLGYLEKLEKAVPKGAVELMDIPGIGPRTAFRLASSGVASVEQLRADIASGKALPGLSPLNAKKALGEIEKMEQGRKRMLISEASLLAGSLVGYFGTRGVEVEAAGSLRRGRSTVGDLDLLTTDGRAAELLAGFPGTDRVIGQGTTKSSIRLKNGVQVDLRVVDSGSYGAALLYFTGSKDHNIALRNLAIEKGWKLNEYALAEAKTDRKIAGRTEQEVYKRLGLDYIPPELRENTGEVEAAKEGRLPKLVDFGDLRGDLQMHTTWSDGADELEAMASAAKKKGYEYIAVTDHSASLRVANGLSEERFREQWKAIDKLNDRLAPFRILKGVEAEVGSDGSLDYDSKFLSQFDYVGVAIHQGFRQSAEKLTERALKVLSDPHVDVLFHPTNRMIGRREGLAIDLRKVVECAKKNGKLLEIDGQPNRLDLDEAWSKRAKEEGVKLVIDSDAHSVDALEYVSLGVTVGKRGWLETGDVANSLHLNQLLRLLG